MTFAATQMEQTMLGARLRSTAVIASVICTEQTGRVVVGHRKMYAQLALCALAYLGRTMNSTRCGALS